ncbi:AraC family transcriptional regulator [uncultured Desulfobacter sp.]|uniref:helix-turn-helix domain-containing protein n=1 Tax=uncultured Desulfobacter sp. TaxID=240139 RepID=UPI002AA86C80|nr:AraC family transcriptional regulator [uncultured Desulfobacter sp.]
MKTVPLARQRCNDTLQNQSTYKEYHSFESYKEIPKSLGKGYSKTIKLISDTVLCIANIKFFKNYDYEIDEKLPDLGFGFCLSGQNYVKKVLKYNFAITKDQSSFYHLSDKKGVYQIIPNDRFISVGIMMQTDSFRSFMEEEQHYQSTALRKIVEKNRLDAFRYVDTITLSMRQIIKQILHCPYHEPTHRLFFEAKALELIFHKLNQIESLTIQAKRIVPGNQKNRDKIYMAEELLKKNMDNPPGLSELSRSVGISRTQLLRDFQAIFNTSPYSHLRDMRLRKAKTILYEGETNITETAYIVGYSSASHFTKAFKQHFGMTPSCYIRTLRA